MIFDRNPRDNLYHIMIPIVANDLGRKEKCVIASCTDPKIIDIPVPGNLHRHVIYIDDKEDLLFDDIPIELKTLCPDCLRLNDPEKVKQELVLIKLQGKNYKVIL